LLACGVLVFIGSRPNTAILQAVCKHRPYCHPFSKNTVDAGRVSARGLELLGSTCCREKGVMWAMKAKRRALRCEIVETPQGDFKGTCLELGLVVLTSFGDGG